MFRTFIEQHIYTSAKIWNMDDAGITRVHVLGSHCEQRRSPIWKDYERRDRGVTVTVICAMSAGGQFLPPRLTFPRKRILDQLMRGAPEQMGGHWTGCDLLVKWLQNSVAVTNTSKAYPQIIILDTANTATSH